MAGSLLYIINKTHLFAWLFISLILIKIADGQIVQLHGFQQKIYGGTIQENVTDASNKDSSNYQQVMNGSERFFLFAEIRNTKKTKVAQLWLNGLSYKFTTKKVESLPVVQFSSIKNDTLIHNSRNDIIQIMLTGDTSLPQSHRLSQLIVKNDIVVVYYFCNRKRYVTLKKIIKLHPIFAP